MSMGQSVVSVGTDSAHPTHGLSSRFKALISVLSSTCGLPFPLLVDMGLWATQLVNDGSIIAYPLGR